MSWAAEAPTQAGQPLVARAFWTDSADHTSFMMMDPFDTTFELSHAHLTAGTRVVAILLSAAVILVDDGQAGDRRPARRLPSRLRLDVHITVVRA
jgi:hypothetical protein